jgi:uncharacterized membrane protein
VRIGCFISAEGKIAGMSELIMIAYKDQYRASEVLNELQRREWEWVGDLDHAVVVRHDEKDRYRVLLSVDPTTKEEEPWARMWGSLISLVLADSISQGMVRAVREVSSGSGEEPISRKERLDATWWIENICITREFIRDASAVIQPGDSALFMLLKTQNPYAALKKLRNYGGTLLRTSLSAEQDARLIEALT